MVLVVIIITLPLLDMKPCKVLIHVNLNYLIHDKFRLYDMWLPKICWVKIEVVKMPH